MNNTVALGHDSNQALGLGQFAVDFLSGALGPGPSEEVLERTKTFHTDAVLCGISALALRTNAPTVLRTEALAYPDQKGATVFGSNIRLKPEKAIVANASAVREWDSNGTNFGFNPALGHVAGEFGHNDYYPVAIAASQVADLDGAMALKAMVLIDEIRGRLAEVFSLKDHKIDHVVHGAIASAAAYGALLGATPEQIESAIGMFVAHYIPWRAIRAGHQLSDSKGASAAISTEAAVLCAKRSLAGFKGPADIFRNPQAMFRQFEHTNGESPFELVLTHSGHDFAIMGMHLKLGLYEHQSAGALQGLIDLLAKHPHLAAENAVVNIMVTAYEPAFSIIGDPAKRDPRTRQSADHSMVYIVATLLRKAIDLGIAHVNSASPLSPDDLWEKLMLEPADYSDAALTSPRTKSLIERITFKHGGPEFDAGYPDGIPTTVEITDSSGQIFSSGMVMYPAGHARNTSANLQRLLAHKFHLLGSLGLTSTTAAKTFIDRTMRLDNLAPKDLLTLYDTEIADRPGIISD